MTILEISLMCISTILLLTHFVPRTWTVKRKHYPSTEYTLYLLINTDLKMSDGKIISQICHALESVHERADPDLIKVWKKSGKKKVVLKSNTASMNEIVDVCRKKSILSFSVFDAGRTQVESGSFTVLAIGPEQSEKSGELVKSLKLY